MSPAVATFLFEIANFLCLAAALGWLFFRPVRKLLDERRAALRAEDETAARKLAEAEQIRGDIAQRQQTLAEELEAQRARSRAAADQEAQAILQRAREQALRELEAANKSLVTLEKGTQSRLALAATAAAGEVVARLLALVHGGDLDEALLRVACVQMAQFQAPLDPVTIESARPLGALQQAALASVLGNETPFSQRVVPELLGGIRVITGRGMVDVSIAGLAQYAESTLAAHLGQLRDG